MAKYVVTKWLIGLSSVAAFTGFIGLSKQTDIIQSSSPSQISSVAPEAYKQEEAGETYVVKKSKRTHKDDDYKKEKDYKKKKDDHHDHDDDDDDDEKEERMYKRWKNELSDNKAVLQSEQVSQSGKPKKEISARSRAS
ncbi:hypothetical protein [Aneurinibacillus aneurinilyticus]|jgi:hypothetical protein|uniref:Uncharacterized protein n=1 Tax=Aneurinibacillus aneurinilyticus ATCC 12856 TaxID=649747 RepID=U1WM22_ANEAE|nr:hypothetical protein [Aneurinibacillus aneurinilyticus]ERI09644.1 hypothetical protein HMPREF0083_02274 [Aneurinibacillus aneurinilyticus ATCC 12856]MCI1696493.1 hypothetical protein [Aneurinibacillus aneurinilyticus]MED0673041.1 hypothetical protein [Aneurinibacillus aneurinilyticus]MED0709545.1 hypothetical protein [Aneurinibacillus aneurinilyticus]MED0725960.1 hypothetical protein [Aneurinibacillus aneurinilyticus]